MKPSLIFLNCDIRAYSGAVDKLVAGGVRKLVLRGQADFSHKFEAKLQAKHPAVQVLRPAPTDKPTALDDSVAVILLETSPEALSALLMEYAGAEAGVVCAPITKHHMSQRAVLANSLPKAGTHLLFKLLEAFGFKRPASDDLPLDEDRLEPGHYYSLQHMTREHLARPIQMMGRFVGEFSRCPILFMVRDPRDVAVSLAHYLAVQTDYHVLQAYFSGLSPQARLVATIEGDYSVPVYINRTMVFRGSIRDLFMAYADWIRHPFGNAVVLRFEDLIGPQGGGDRRAQLKSIWAAQLALHVAGSPEQFADGIFSKSSVTFRKGQIGSYKKEFGKQHLAAFDSLNQDFMGLFGYAESSQRKLHYPLWRGFHGEIKPGDDTIDWQRSGRPTLLVEGYLGFNIVSHLGKWFAFAQSAGPVDLDHLNDKSLDSLRGNGECAIGENLADVKTEVLRLVVSRNIEEVSRQALEKEYLGRQELDDRLNELSSRVELRQDALSRRLEGEVQDTAKRSEEGLAKLSYCLEQRLEELSTCIEGKLQSIEKRGKEAQSELGARLQLSQDELAERLSRVVPQDADSSRLLEQDYLGFNLLSSGNRIWAVDISVGEVNFADAETIERLRASGHLLAAGTLDGARIEVLSHKIALSNDALSQRIAHIEPTASPDTVLLEQDYRGYNLVASAGRIWAAEMAAGCIDLGDADVVNQWLADGRLLVSVSLDGARAQVDRLLDRCLFEQGLARLGATVESYSDALTARFESGLDEFTRRSMDRLSAMEDRVRAGETLIEAHIKTVSGNVESGLQAAVRENNEHFGKMQNRLGNLIESRLRDLSGSVEHELQNAAREGDQRLDDMRLRLQALQGMVDGHLMPLSGRIESGLQQASTHSEERLKELATRMEQSQRLMQQKIHERVAALERTWWQRLTGTGKTKGSE